MEFISKGGVKISTGRWWWPTSPFFAQCDAALNVCNEMEKSMYFPSPSAWVLATVNSSDKFDLEGFSPYADNSVWTCRSLVCLSMMKELCNVLKAFRTWVANKSEGDIMKENFTFAEFFWESEGNTFLDENVGVWNVPTFFKHSNMFKQTNHVFDVKISRVDMRFCEFLWMLTERCQHAAFIRIFLWLSSGIDWLSLCEPFPFLKDDVLVADPGRSWGFWRSLPSTLTFLRIAIVRTRLHSEWYDLDKNYWEDSERFEPCVDLQCC